MRQFFSFLSLLSTVFCLLFPVISFLPSTFSSIRLLTPAPITNVLNVIYPVSTNSQAPFHRVFLLQASLSFLPFFLTHSGPQHSKFLWAIWFRVSPLHLPHAYSTQNLREHDAGKQNKNKLLKICSSPVPHKGLGRKFSWYNPNWVLGGVWPNGYCRIKAANLLILLVFGLTLPWLWRDGSK